MDEDDVISEPVENLPQFNPHDPSGRGEEEKPPKNPGGVEAFFVVLILGVLPDTIDALDLGTLSTFTSIISWPATEYYFHQKNLQVPNIKKWIRGLNIGDAVPIVGILPLKTIALIIAIYMAWHPDSKITKAAKAADAATSVAEGKKPAAATAGAKGGFRQKIARGIRSTKEFFGGGGEGEEDEEENLSLGYERGGGDIYEKMNVGGVRGPEEEAEAKAFEEITSAPPKQEEIITTQPSAGIQRQTTQTTTASTAPQENKTQEESGKIGGAYEQEKKIMGTMESSLEVEGILQEKPIPINQSANSQGIPTHENERVVDLSGKDK